MLHVVTASLVQPEVHLRVNGMMAKSCSRKVENALRFITGVSDVVVSLKVQQFGLGGSGFRFGVISRVVGVEVSRWQQTAP